VDLKIPDCLPKDSWFRKWISLWPTAESPKSFILFSGMTILGACLGRKIWIDQDIHLVRPMLNLLLIGPSGIGKSSAVKIAKRLLAHIPETDRPQFFEGGSTKEKLHRDLVHQPKAILFAPELAAFFSREKYKESLIPYVTQLLDYEEVIELRTIKDNLIRVEDPAVTIMGGSTVAWLQEQLPDSAVSGGFLARFLILNEEKKGQRIANPHRLLSTAQRAKLEKLREETFAEFTQIIGTHAGAMDYDDYDAAEAYARWYDTHEPEVGYLAPFAARAGELVLRLSMILAISCKRSSITKEDIVCATQLYEYIAGRLGNIVVPSSQQGKQVSLVLSTVNDNSMRNTDVIKALKVQLSTADVERALEGLVYSGEILGDRGDLKK